MPKLVKVRNEVEGRIEEEFALVEKPKTVAWDVEEELKVVGKPIPRVDGDQRVSGAARYPSDIQLPGMLHAKILRSPHPHARIKRIDTTRAQALPGVRAVLTRANAPGTAWSHGKPLLDDTVRYEGDEVAAVAADNVAIARQAVRLIEVEYEPLPFVTDVSAALKEDAPVVRQGKNLMDGEAEVYERGDVDKAFKQAEVVVEGEFETPTQVHNSFETHGSVVSWEGDQLTVYDSTQNLHGVRDRVADYLGLQKNRVRVVKHYMGGGFGSKNGAGAYTVIAALLAKQTNRPVRLFLDRSEENHASGARSSTKQHLKLGAKKDGALVAIDLTAYSNVGARATWAGAIEVPAKELYDCRNVRTRVYHVFTNTGPFAPFRAPGVVEAMFALESLIDELAEKLGMDPLDLRIKNYARRSPLDGKPYSSNGLLDAYQEGARAIGWYDKRKKKQGERKKTDGSSVRRGLGMASQLWFGAGGAPSYAQVKIHPDASATIITGTQDIGTGTKTILTQIAAEELSLPIEKFRIEIGDTQWGLYSTLSAGSMTAASVGPAVREAAADAKAQLLDAACKYLGLTRTSAKLENGIVRGTKRGQKVEKPLAEILGELGDIMFVGQGSRAPNPTNVTIRTFGAQFAEVEVDVDTGAIRVLKIVASHDCGRVLNPLTTSSQIEGGVIQGLGYALMEQRITDEKTGMVVNPNLEGYRIPTMMDIPEIEVRMIDRADPLINNLGAKGVGEPPIIPTAPAIANAVADAIGVRLHKLPMTRDVVLEQLYGTQMNTDRH
jgi:xanthine dehydrogenase YagR molybdenum-binding subunit